MDHGGYGDGNSKQETVDGVKRGGSNERTIGGVGSTWELSVWVPWMMMQSKDGAGYGVDWSFPTETAAYGKRSCAKMNWEVVFAARLAVQEREKETILIAIIVAPALHAVNSRRERGRKDGGVTPDIGEEPGDKIIINDS
ncbi:hypothetical protein PAXINDRAFT_154788 [Paxillus involutus ATCC 200175]|nr:hypothetical protein PAXINDRAFT_154788 [Paxillus involutus ATCC 200175]